MTHGNGLARGARGGVLFKLLLVMIVVGALAALTWMLFLPAVLARQVRGRTGFDVRIERLASNPFTGRVHLDGLLIDNPAEFERREFVRARRLQADLQLFTLWQKQAVFDWMLVDLEEVVLVTRPDGTTNLELFRERLERGPDPALASPLPVLPIRAEGVLIKRLDVTFDRLTLVNLARPAAPPRELNLRFAHVYENISDPKQLFVPSFLRSVVGASGGSLEGLWPDPWSSSIGGWTRAGGTLLRNSGERAGALLKSLAEKLEETRKP